MGLFHLNHNLIRYPYWISTFVDVAKRNSGNRYSISLLDFYFCRLSVEAKQVANSISLLDFYFCRLRFKIADSGDSISLLDFYFCRSRRGSCPSLIRYPYWISTFVDSGTGTTSSADSISLLDFYFCRFCAAPSCVFKFDILIGFLLL